MCGCSWRPGPTRRRGRRLSQLDLGPTEGLEVVGPGQWHITLRFLGEVGGERVPALVEALGAAAAELPGALPCQVGPGTAWFGGDRVLQIPVSGLEQAADAINVLRPVGRPRSTPRAGTVHRSPHRRPLEAPSAGCVGPDRAGRDPLRIVLPARPLRSGGVAAHSGGPPLHGHGPHPPSRLIGRHPRPDGSVPGCDRRDRRRPRGCSMLWTLLALAAVALVALTLSDPSPAAASGLPGPQSDTSPVAAPPPSTWPTARPTSRPSSVPATPASRCSRPTLLRLQYSPSGRFEDRPTVNAVNRQMPVPRYTDAGVRGLAHRSDRSGHVPLQGRVPGHSAPTTPHSRSPPGGVTGTCPAELGVGVPLRPDLPGGRRGQSGGAALSHASRGYQSTAGYVGYLDHPGASATWTVLGRTGRDGAAVHPLLEPARPRPPPSRAPIGLRVDGRLLATLVAAPTDSATRGRTLSTTVPAQAGTNVVKMVSQRSDASISASTPCRSVRPVLLRPFRSRPTLWADGSGASTPSPTARGRPCTPGRGARLPDGHRAPPHRRPPGRRRLAAARRHPERHLGPSGWVQPRQRRRRPRGRLPVRLRARLRGRPAHLRPVDRPGSSAAPQCLRGVVLGLFALHQCRGRGPDLPAFQKYQVPLDTLSLDTEWKAPNSWDGWEWDTSLFPDPGSFLRWTRAHGIDLTLNIHSSIADNDPAAG